MTIWLWVGFVLLVVGLLALDLGVFHRKAHAIGAGEALAWTGFWIFLALLFGAAVYAMYECDWLGIAHGVGGRQAGSEAALQYLAGYLVEKSLSLDNIFVIALIIAYFQVPAAFQHRLLFWGILAALVMRGAMIVAGLALLNYVDWLTYVFGGLLLVAAGKMLFAGEVAPHPSHNPLVKLARRLYPVSPGFDGARFFTRIDGRRAITPLFVALLLVESSDLLFAVDSIPAVFAITRDPFLVFTSNVFAILGLRSLYFALAGLMDKFQYLKFSLVVLLLFIAAKMLLAHYVTIPTPISLAVIAGVVALGMISSALLGRGAGPRAPLGREP